jgi:hypothetical protein
MYWLLNSQGLLQGHGVFHSSVIRLLVFVPVRRSTSSSGGAWFNVYELIGFRMMTLSHAPSLALLGLNLKAAIIESAVDCRESLQRILAVASFELQVSSPVLLNTNASIGNLYLHLIGSMRHELPLGR